MDYKTIHDYVDDTYPLIKETKDSIVFSIPKTQYELVLIPAIGKLNSSCQEMIINSIYTMIEEDPSHSVAGTYTIDNIERRPDNFFILFQKSVSIHCILNIRENEQILMLTLPFNHFTDQNEINNILRHVLSLLTLSPEYFIFASGLDLSQYLETNLNFDHLSHQLVHKLQEFTPKNVALGDEYKFLIFDGDRNNSKLYLLRSTYHYNDPDDQLVQYLMTNPHLLLINKSSNEIIAKARINGYTPRFAVIGGIEVIKKYRRKGFGYQISHKIVELIVDKAESVVLDTDRDNFPALRIYSSIGFKMVGKHVFIEKGKKVIAAIHGDREY